MRVSCLVPLGPLHQAFDQGFLMKVLPAKSGEVVEWQPQPNRPARRRAASAKPTRRTRVCALAIARCVRHTGRPASTSIMESSCAMPAGSRTKLPVTRRRTTYGTSKVSAHPHPTSSASTRFSGARCVFCLHQLHAGRPCGLAPEPNSRGSTRCVAQIAQNQRGAWRESLPLRPLPTW